MKRRELLVRVGSLAVWLPASRLLVGCGGSNESSNDTGGPPSLRFTSSTDDGHSHQVALEVAIIEDPPASGTQPTTSEASGHVHTVVLTEADLVLIRDNQPVTKSTTIDATGHSHSFTFRRSAGTPTGGGDDYERPDGY
jgi:hypothetical protein